ncbi:MAG TPA: amylo-alpha-1,6-glucosidase [Terriglobales bacterium]
MSKRPLYVRPEDSPERRALDRVTRALTWNAQTVPPEEWEVLLTREWLVTNGLGGYASGTISGTSTRRFHGLLIAALPSPHGRTMMLNDVTEQIIFPNGDSFQLGGEETASGKTDLRSAKYLTHFSLRAGLPVWTFSLGDVLLEKRLHLVHAQNTVHLSYSIKGPHPVTVLLRPSVYFRPHEGSLSGLNIHSYSLHPAGNNGCEISNGSNLGPLRLLLHGEQAKLDADSAETPDLRFRIEQSRGYDFQGNLWSPGFFSFNLGPEGMATLIGSTEPWEIVRALQPEEALHSEFERRRRLLSHVPLAASEEIAAEMVLAADQFIITPAGRLLDEARALAAGDEVRTVIAGYHWFTDWGRDTMISLEGLTLTTGRHVEAGYILRTFAQYIRDGLIPNMFPEGKNDGLYHTADATLWFFHAVKRYMDFTSDRATLRLLLPHLIDIVNCHLQGTRFGIKVDPEDGLLRQGAEGYQLTWMDAKVGDWVVTPRRGKAVEINALWYNALRLLESWTREERNDNLAGVYAAHAKRAHESFNRRFWYAQGGYLYDVIDGEKGDDAACRPNQLFAISLDHPVLERKYWEPVLDVVREKLLTPVGLRSLSAGHPDYKPRYDGDLRARDAAYHQGTVWGWLIGPFVDAYLKLHPHDSRAARGFLEGFTHHLNEACIGSVSEIFDADPPFTPRGCIAQAWSVAELLRIATLTA